MYDRQLGFYDPSKYNPAVTLVGAGGIGSSTALALAKLGVRRITLYDHDNVEPHNVPNQLHPVEMADPEYRFSNKKVSGVSDVVSYLASDSVDGRPYKFGMGSAVGDVLISAVDSMDARRVIYDRWLKSKSRWLIDGRIGGEVIRVYTVDAEDFSQVARYQATLIPNTAVAPTRCTEAAVIDVMFCVASLITRSFRLAITGDKPEFEVIYDQRNLYVLKG